MRLDPTQHSEFMSVGVFALQGDSIEHIHMLLRSKNLSQMQMQA
jgi:glutamine amidotransferase PdxT